MADQSVEDRIAQFFDRESRDYRIRHEEKGIPESMRLQTEILIERKAEPVLDVGSGPGSLLLELLDGGISRVIGLDLSNDMIQVTQKRMDEKGYGDKVSLIHGNFLTTNLEEKPGSISLHRVICCHPDKDGMLARSANYQPEIITISILRDWKLLRGLVGIFGLVARLIKSFRPYVHSQKYIDEKMQELGYSILTQHKKTWWVTTTYESMNSPELGTA